MAKNKTINMVKSQVIYKDYSKDAERTALVSGENLSHMFGKIARWYTDISWVGHTHTEANITDFGTYAGASTKGGAATSANKLNIGSADIGSETKPVYFSYLTGKPVACTYSLNASVPANAVFTDINVKQSPSTADESREVLFAGNTGNTETTGTVGKSNKLYFNPSTGALTATSFSGSMAASNLTGTIDAGRLPTTAVTAGSYGPAAGGTLTYGGTFDVPYVTVDKYGRLTAGSTKTFTMPAQYVHPSTSGNKHIPSGGSSGQYLKWSSDGTATWSAIAATDLPSHTHSEYLPLAGGTMTGDLAFTTVTSTTYPAVSNQISFGSSTDGGQIFFEVQASDAGALVIQTTDDPNAKIVFRNKVTSGGTRANEVTITDGVISGNGSGLTNIVSAGKWTTARTITIGSTGKSVDGSGNVSWTLSEIGAAASTHSHSNYLPQTTATAAPDLNTYTSTGVYHIPFSSTNAPVTQHSTLYVDYVVGTPYQIFKPDNVDTTWYTRHRVSDSWSEWVALKLTDTVYTHPSYTAKSSGLYKITVDGTGHVSATAAVAAADLPSHTHSYLPLTGGTVTGGITYKGTTYDISAADNGVTSTVWPTTFNLIDKSDRIFTRLEGILYTNGDVGCQLYVRNYNTSGTQVAQKGITFIMNKSGSLSWSVSDPANFRTAINAAAADHNHGTLYNSFTSSVSTTTNTWAAAGLNGTGHVIKSIRTEASAPAYLLSGYAAGIGFGGSDTRGVISIRYDTPSVRFAGGNKTATDGGTAAWYFTLSATSAQTYTFPTTGGTLTDIIYKASNYYATASHTHSEYLPLAGGTMTGDLSFASVTSTEYPAVSKQITFGGSTDGGQIFFEVTASDKGCLVLQTTDDPDAKIVFRNKVTSGGTRANEVTITDGVLAGNGSGLTNLNASNISSGTIAAARLPDSYLPLSGGTMTGVISSTVTTSTHIAGNKGTAIINSTAGAGYNMLAKMKSSNGVFTIGTYNDKFSLYYTTDTIISAGTNTTTYDILLLNEAGNTQLGRNLYFPQKADGIYYTGTKATSRLIRFIDNTSDAYGNGIGIGGGGVVCIGAGEASDALIDASIFTPGSEKLYLASDEDIILYSNCQTIGNRVGIVYDLSGRLRPDTNNTRTLGGTDYYWNKAYIKLIYGGSNGSWISGRDNAVIINNTVPAGDSYAPVIAVKTNLGSWTVGSLGSSSKTTEHLYFSYTTDANYNAGTNASSNYYLSSSGWFSGTAAKADKWSTARTLTIGSTGKSVDGSGNVSWSLSEIGAAASSHTHSYLPLSGGTLTGDLNFTGVTSTSYPAKSNQIYFSGSTDWAKIYYRVDASDAGRLVFDIGDDTNTRIDFAYNGTTKSYIDTSGNFSGVSYRASYLDIVAGNEIRFSVDSKPANAIDLYLGYAWSGGTKDAKINRYVFMNGNATLTNVKAALFEGKATSSTYTNYDAVFNIQTGSSKQAKISLETLINWLINTKKVLPASTLVHKIIQTGWAYADNDFLQISCNGRSYEIQLAGVALEFIGSVSSYNSGEFRLFIHTSPTTAASASSGYVIAPTSTTFVYTCNGSGYSPTWKMISNFGKYANGYWGLTDPNGTDNDWTRTTSLGIIPYQSGSLGSGHQSLGTSSWYFSYIYADQHAGYRLGLGSGSIQGRIDIQSPTTASVAYNSTNPRIRFMNAGADQNIDIIMCDFDSVRGPAALSVHGNQGGEYLLAPNISAWDYTNNKLMAMLSAWSLGTTSAVGQGRVIAGNSTKKGTAGNARGYIEIYSEQDGCVFLTAPSTITTAQSGYVVTLPSSAGTMTDIVYKSSSSYLSSSGGTLSGDLQVGTSNSTTLPNGGIRIHDIRSVNVPASGFANRSANFYFHMTDSPDTSKWWSILHVRGWNGNEGYGAWELAGHAHNDDARTRPLYVRCTNAGSAWGSWRKIYDSSNKPTLSELGAVPNTEAGVSAAINKLSTGSSTPTDNDYYVAQYAGGGTTTTSYHRRPVSALFAYINSKLYKILWSGSTSCTARSSTSITLTTAISANKYRFIKVVWNCGTYTGISEFRADTLNVTNNIPSGSDATTTNMIQFKIASDGKSVSVGPGTTTITVIQIAGVYPI